MNGNFIGKLCAKCKAMAMDEGMTPEGEALMGEEEMLEEPGKEPVESFDDADKRGMMRIMIGLGKGAGKGKMRNKLEEEE